MTAKITTAPEANKRGSSFDRRLEPVTLWFTFGHYCDSLARLSGINAKLTKMVRLSLSTHRLLNWLSCTTAAVPSGPRSHHWNASLSWAGGQPAQGSWLVRL